jgi:uncharacterized protein (DUF1499 family)
MPAAAVPDPIPVTRKKAMAWAAMRGLTLTVQLWPGIAVAALFGNLLAGSAPDNLGIRDGLLAPCPAKPNCVSSQAPDGNHRIAPLEYRGSATDAMTLLARVVAAQPGATIVTSSDIYLYATFQSPLMGFVDDVEFAIDPARKLVEVRSASRLGYSDLGANRKRVDSLRAAFAEAQP